MEKIKITGDEPATGFSIPGDDKAGWHPESVHGLTIRQHLAGMAMQGLLTQANDKNSDFNNLADCAVIYADALIKSLNK